MYDQNNPDPVGLGSATLVIRCLRNKSFYIYINLIVKGMTSLRHGLFLFNDCLYLVSDGRVCVVLVEPAVPAGVVVKVPGVAQAVLQVGQAGLLLTPNI